MKSLQLLSLLALFFLSTGLFAQEQKTMLFEGKEVQVSQELESSLYGIFVKNEGKRKWQYAIRPEGQESFYLEQEQESAEALRFEWDFSQKADINWGLMLDEEGKPLTITISEIENGQMKNYAARIVLVHYQEKNRTEALHLYEAEGQYYLGYAKKINEVATILPERRD